MAVTLDLGEEIGKGIFCIQFAFYTYCTVHISLHPDIYANILCTKAEFIKVQFRRSFGSYLRFLYGFLKP